MTELLSFGIGFAAGSTALWLIYKPKLVQLNRPTCRDAQGRFIKREKGESL